LEQGARIGDPEGNLQRSTCVAPSMHEYEISVFDTAGDLSECYNVWCADISVFSATLAARHGDCAVFARLKQEALPPPVENAA
jgi:hypothetical protein